MNLHRREEWSMTFPMLTLARLPTTELGRRETGSPIQLGLLGLEDLEDLEDRTDNALIHQHRPGPALREAVAIHLHLPDPALPVEAATRLLHGMIRA